MDNLSVLTNNSVNSIIPSGFIDAIIIVFIAVMVMGILSAFLGFRDAPIEKFGNAKPINDAVKSNDKKVSIKTTKIVKNTFSSIAKTKADKYSDWR